MFFRFIEVLHVIASFRLPRRPSRTNHGMESGDEGFLLETHDQLFLQQPQISFL